MTVHGNIRWLVLATLFLAIVSSGDLQAAKKKRGGSSKGRGEAIQAIRQGIAIRKQIAAAAQQQLNAAVQKGTIAQSTLDVWASNADAAVQQARAAKTKSDSESDNVNDIEGDILSALPDDSPYRMAEETYLEALEAFERARRHVLNSSEYKREYEFAKNGPDANERLARLRQEALDGDDEVVRTRRSMQTAKGLLGKEFVKLVTADDAWKNAVDVSREARTDEAKAKLAIRSAMIHRLGAASSRNEALKSAVGAQQTLTKARSDIVKLEAALKKMQSSGNRSRSRSSSGKK